MSFDPTLAAFRFGTGLSPVHAAPTSIAAMLDGLAGPDTASAMIPIARFSTATPSIMDYVTATRARRAATTDADMAAKDAVLSAMTDAARAMVQDNTMRVIARGVTVPDGLRERLVAFWADHFTVIARNRQQHHLVTLYVEEAIRPHVTGSFRDMLRAVATRSMMILYLQQTESSGPASDLGLRRGRGLNENLARELLELHALGVGGSYDQTDVRELAELLTGLTYDPARGFVYDARMAEPGAETVLGITYSADATLETVLAALDDIAVHPDTAHHLARKLVVHFVSDTPNEDLIAHLAGVFGATGGDLMAVTQALLNHPAAWVPAREKVRRPLEFIIAALRALGVPAATLLAMPNREYRRHILGPLRVMGQPWETPVGPDGWPEAATDWVIPQAMAGRISWAMSAPKYFADPLPDPRDFVTMALGNAPPQEVVFAAASAEAVADGIGIVLAAPAFQRR